MDRVETNLPIALVTGAAGFIGSHVCLGLERLGWQIIALTRRPLHSRFPKIKPLVGDITVPDSLNDLQKQDIKAIFHFAALVPHNKENSYGEFMTANAVGTANLLDYFGRSKAEIFVYASGTTVIGKPQYQPIKEDHPLLPVTPYQVSKLSGEYCCTEFARRTGRKVVSLRISSPYGPGMPNSVLSFFLRCAKEGKTLSVYGTGARVQNFLWVEDIIHACTANYTSNHTCYNLAGPTSISMLELAKLACELNNRDLSFIRTNFKEDPEENSLWFVDNTLLQSEIGVRPSTDIRSGCEQYLAFLSEHGNYHGWWE